MTNRRRAGMDAAAIVAAGMRRCMPATARVTHWHCNDGTLIIVTVPAAVPPMAYRTADLALIDTLADCWGHRGNSRRRTLWAIVNFDSQAERKQEPPPERVLP